MTQYRFIEPLDVLFLRGNRLFGESSGGGSALMPPWPSVFAGALRSRMLTDAGVDPVAYGRGNAELSAPLAEVLGTPADPGRFAIVTTTLAQTDEAGEIEPIHALPADVQVYEGADGRAVPHSLEPVALPDGIAGSLSLARMPVLARDTREKPLSGYWLTAAGWRKYLHGQALDASDLVPQAELWKTEQRLGIALSSGRRSASDGQLYTADAISLSRERRVGFLVGVSGVTDGILPESGTLRLGGDARGAALRAVEAPPAGGPDWEAIERSGSFRLVLTTPGIFPGGWRLPGLDSDGCLRFHGASAWLVSATVLRRQTVSGWDLASKRPKAAVRAAPTGSVYWFEGLEGDVESLRKLSKTGLWSLQDDNNHPDRRAEGFNRLAIANA